MRSSDEALGEIACSSSRWPQRKANGPRPMPADMREISPSVRAAWSAAAQAKATANEAADSSVVNGRAAYGGRLETSDSPQRPAIASEMREVQLQLGLGIQRPSQTRKTDAQAREVTASVGTVRVVSQVATIAAVQVLAASASRTPSDRRFADASEQAHGGQTGPQYFTAGEREHAESGGDERQPEREQWRVLRCRHAEQHHDEQRGAGGEDPARDGPKPRAQPRPSGDQDGSGIGGEHGRRSLARAGDEGCDRRASESDAPERRHV